MVNDSRRLRDGSDVGELTIMRCAGTKYVSSLSYWLVGWFLLSGLTSAGAEPQATITSSSVAATYQPAGAVDGDRFSGSTASMWKATSSKAWWQIEFAQPQPVGSILQVNGDHDLWLRNAPRNYVWQWSRDGQLWINIRETVIRHEKRLFRIHRLKEPIETKYLRCMIYLSAGPASALREVEFYAATDADVKFDDWIVSIGSMEDRDRTFSDTRFIDLARQCEGWERAPAQLIWHGDCDLEFSSIEPRPLCAFLSGSFLEWCQCSREPWRGVQEILKSRTLPMWGACGGAQILAILDETGVEHPWDCPRCRDPQHPQLAVYSHIGHTGPAPCGDYSQNVGERGKFKMRKVADDPAFAGLPEVFEVMESHVGQIAYVPKGWRRVVTNGPGALTENQCLRVENFPIYAAQFHIELEGTPENSRRIMANFLTEAKELAARH